MLESRLPDDSFMPFQRDEVTMSGQSETIPGRGFPGIKDPEHRGDLILVFRVVFPTKLSVAQAKALRQVLGADQISVIEDMIDMAAAAEQRAVEEMFDQEEQLYAEQCPEWDTYMCLYDEIVAYKLHWSVHAFGFGPEGD